MYILVAASLLFTMPVFAVPKMNKLGAMEISPRASYLGGWTQGRDGTGAGCPSSSVACDSGSYSLLNTQCCPTGQTCFASSIIAYCCPSSTDCKTSVVNFPVCAGTGLDMYYSPGGHFCCEANEKGINPSSASSSYDGLCVPADQPVASSLLAKIETQIGTVASPTGSSGSVISSASSPVSSASSPVSLGSSRASPTTSASLISVSSGSSSGDSETTTTTAKGSSATGLSNTGDSTTTTDKSSSGSSKLGVGPIVGIAIGGVAILLLAAILFFLVKRSRAKKHQQSAYNAQQYSQPPMNHGPGIPEVSGVGVAPGLGRKPVASTTTNPAYNTSPSAGYVSPISTTPSPGPPGYANLATPQGQYGPPPPPPESYNPHANYAEMDSNGYPVNRVELRGQ